METDASSNFCGHFGVVERLHVSMKAWELLPLRSCGKVSMYQVRVVNLPSVTTLRFLPASYKLISCSHNSLLQTVKHSITGLVGWNPVMIVPKPVEAPLGNGLFYSSTVSLCLGYCGLTPPLHSPISHPSRPFQVSLDTLIHADFSYPQTSMSLADGVTHPCSALNLRDLEAECGLWSQTEFNMCGATYLRKTSEPAQALVSY